MENKRLQMFSKLFYSLSGYQDSNLGPPAPKAGALTGLRYTPMHPLGCMIGGERGIRTPGTGNPVRQFSKLLVSATHPSLRVIFVLAKVGYIYVISKFFS